MFERLHKNSILPHIVAAVLALIYAWGISQSAYVKTGLQFISPLLVIMAIHLVWLARTNGVVQGFSIKIFQRSVQTAMAMACIIFAASIIAPTPASADVGNVVGGILGILFCAAIIAAVIAIAAWLLYGLFRIVRAIVRRFRTSDTDDTNTRFFDAASLIVAVAFLGIASFEGVAQSYSFATKNQATATRVIDAPPAKVWQTLETATSPRFTLPKMLQVFPQPVGVIVDEGTRLGANRVVAFQGREGAGQLRLRVAERTNQRAVFEVQSDTSPFAIWVAYKTLTYTVTPEGAGTRLSVALEYDRQLAPTWVFTPMIKGAAYLAMDVLARDVAARSGRLDG